MAEIPAGLDPVPHAENTALVAHSLVERVKGIEPSSSAWKAPEPLHGSPCATMTARMNANAAAVTILLTILARRLPGRLRALGCTVLMPLPIGQKRRPLWPEGRNGVDELHGLGTVRTICLRIGHSWR